MFLAYVTVLFLLGWLLAMLYIGPSYFRRLRELIDLLSKHHPSTFGRLGQPSLDLLKMQIGSSASLVSFVLRKAYLDLDDPEATRIGNAARWRLLFSFSGALIPVLFAFTDAPI